MTDIVPARAIAKRTIDAFADDGGGPLVLLDAKTLESDAGWAFFYQSVRFLETGHPADRLAGNGPLIVRRADGHVIHAGTAMPIETALALHGSDWRQVGTRDRAGPG